MLELREVFTPSEYFEFEHARSDGNRSHADCGQGICSTQTCGLLRDVGKLKHFDKGDVIFWDGDDNDYLYLVLSGVVRGTKLLGDGRRQVTRFAFPGEVLEYSRRSRLPFTAEAITTVAAIAIPRLQLERIANATPCLRKLLMQTVLDELHETRCQVMALGRLSAIERVAQFLYTLAIRTDSQADGSFNLPMTRLDIADYLGLTIETVSRVISRLKRDGKIQLLASDRVRIPDLDDFANDLLTDAV